MTNKHMIYEYNNVDEYLLEPCADSVKFKSRKSTKIKCFDDCLVVTVDVSSYDEPMMLVTRSMDDLSFEVVNTIHGEEVLDIYERLIGKKYLS